MKKITIFLLLTSMFMFIPGVFSAGNSNEEAEALTLMGKLKDPTLDKYQYKDWKQTTIDYLNYVLDETNTFSDPQIDTGLTKRDAKIGRYVTSTNATAYFNEAMMTWGLPSYLGGNQPDNIAGEGIAVLSAVMSGALVGLDMTNYSTPNHPNFNFVKGIFNWYNSEGVFLNGDGTALSGASFWYDLLPGVLYTVIASKYPSEAEYTYPALKTMADGWYKAVVAMGGPNADFYHLGYSIKNNQVIDGGHYEPDAAAGIAYILYFAHQALSQTEGYATSEDLDKYLNGAIWSMNYLDRIDFNPAYEIFHLFSPYIAARMNVEQGTNYNITKLMNDAVSGDAKARSGWGMIFDEKWGDKYAQGLMGSQNDGGGYAFAMGTFDAMMGFAPLVKYDKRYAEEVAKWILAVSQSAQNFYPDQYNTNGKVDTYGDKSVWHGDEQSHNLFAPNSNEASFIPYEGLRKYPRYVQYDNNGNRYLSGVDQSKSPYASGDAFSFNWGGRTDYGLYGGSHVGTFSAISATNIPMVLQTDLDLLDVFSNTDGLLKYTLVYFPTNAATHNGAHTVEQRVINSNNKLYDTLSGEFLETTVINSTTVSYEMMPGTTYVTVELPSNAVLSTDGINVKYGDIVIAQNRASLSATLTELDGKTINSGASVKDTIKTKLNISVPESVNVTSVKVSIGNHVYYQSTEIPTGEINLDTTLATNGITSFVAEVVIEGGIVEKVTIPIRVVNMLVDPAVEYSSIDDMVNKWNLATQIINAPDPLADHDATMSKNDNGDMVITVNSGFAFGFASSDDFYVDFTREPIFDIQIKETTGSYSIKFYVEGMGWHVSGVYLVDDTATPGNYSFNLLAALKAADPRFNPTGALKSSIHIGAVGVGAKVTVGDVSVYHLYQTPNLEEPLYTWGFTYHPAYISMWNSSTSNGAIGNPTLTYNKQGESIVSSSEGSSAVASKVIVADYGQNPVLKVLPKALTGSYYVGIKFLGNDTFYQLTDLINTDTPREIAINKLMAERYPSVVLSGNMNIQILIGVSEGSSISISRIETYYQLPQWGNSVEASDWVDWEVEPGYGNASYTVDANNRIVIANTESAAMTTQLAGLRGKFTVNFDYNPELDIVVRAATGSYRILLQEMGKNEKYILKDWGAQTGRNPIKLNLNDLMSTRLYGLKSVYLTIEVLGGGKSITVETLDTYYTEKLPTFGNTYVEEIPTWNKGLNPSNVFINNDGYVVISQDAFDSNGVSTTISANLNYIPVINISFDSVKVGSKPYIKVTYNGETKTINPTLDDDLVASVNLKSLFEYSEQNVELEIEFGATGTFFEVVIKDIEFIYQLSPISNKGFDRELNKVTWSHVLGATSYVYEIKDQQGQLVASGTTSDNFINLASLELEEGIYNVFVYAKGANYLDSTVERIAILQGDIESVVLDKPGNIKLDGTVIKYDGVENSLGYYFLIKDHDTNEIIFDGVKEVLFVDLVEFGFTANNYTIEVYTLGDGLVYLDSEKTTLEYFKKAISYFSAKTFSTMAIGDNNTRGVYNEELGYTELVIGATGSTWGSVTSNEVSVNFNNNPVLFIDFEETSTWGWFLRINIGGTNYYLADDTFDFSDKYIDIKTVLLSRYPENASVFTGSKLVRFNFGTTSGNPSDIPSARYKGAYIYEVIEGHGEPILGQLATPNVIVNGKVASWNAVPNATSYVFILKNDVGTLISKTITDLSYDFSIILAGGDYEVNVIAKGPNYFDSEAGIKIFELDSNLPGTQEPEDSSLLWTILGITGGLALVAGGVTTFTVLKLKKKQNRGM